MDTAWRRFEAARGGNQSGFDEKMRALEDKGVRFSEVEEPRWGSVTKIRLPGGGEVGLYQPRHAAMVTPS